MVFLSGRFLTHYSQIRTQKIIEMRIIFNCTVTIQCIVPTGTPEPEPTDFDRKPNRPIPAIVTPISCWFCRFRANRGLPPRSVRWRRRCPSAYCSSGRGKRDFPVSFCSFVFDLFFSRLSRSLAFSLQQRRRNTKNRAAGFCAEFCAELLWLTSFSRSLLLYCFPLFACLCCVLGFLVSVCFLYLVI